jgi:hypothetical protein
MSTDEPFLSRWSRRKREGAPAPESEVEIPSAPEGGEELAVASTTPQEQEPPFDLAKLPALDSITAATDIRAFLARGVPAALSREAMRRAWAADPAIRDFIGLSENSWDFTAPGGVPGFGPADPANALKEVAELISPSRALAPRLAEPQAGTDSPLPPRDDDQHRADSPQEPAPEHVDVTAIPHPDESMSPQAEPIAGHDADKQYQDVAPQEARNDAPLGSENRRRRHGGALPS